MEDKDVIEVLKGMISAGKLSSLEAEAVGVAVGALSLMVHTSEEYLKQLKAKKDKNMGEDFA
jgi:hypothetical protein